MSGTFHFKKLKKKSFRNVVTYLSLHNVVQLFSADTLKQKTMDKYASQKLKIVDLLKQFDSKVSFTSDMWTSGNGFSFMAITCHYIYKNWKIKSFILDFIPVSGPHSGRAIMETFNKSVTDDFAIESDKQGAITVDNATANDVFVQELFARSGKPIDYHIWCFVHS